MVLNTLSGEEATIQALENKFVADFNAGDIDAMMTNYVADDTFVIFDVVPRKEHRGADIYRKNWEEFFSHFSDIPKIAITDLVITVDGNVGFSHSFQHVTGTDKEGHTINRTVRVTDGYRKIDGQWLIALEHVSVPVDLKTGKAVFTAK
ncbi:MAG: nuclear transport factor 2 family protein [Chitinophagaceae bacterium]